MENSIFFASKGAQEMQISRVSPSIHHSFRIMLLISQEFPRNPKRTPKILHLRWYLNIFFIRCKTNGIVDSAWPSFEHYLPYKLKLIVQVINVNQA